MPEADAGLKNSRGKKSQILNATSVYLSVFFCQIAISAISNSILVLRSIYTFCTSCSSLSRMLLFAVGELLEKGSLNAKGSPRRSSIFMQTSNVLSHCRYLWVQKKIYFQAAFKRSLRQASGIDIPFSFSFIFLLLLLLLLAVNLHLGGAFFSRHSPPPPPPMLQHGPDSREEEEEEGHCCPVATPRPARRHSFLISQKATLLSDSRNKRIFEI